MVHVNVVYGSLARFDGGHHVARSIDSSPTLASRTPGSPGHSRKRTGYLFINAVLCEVPGISTGANKSLKDGDHIGIFSVDRLYPYQYRDGLPISDGLENTQEHGAMHHSYR
jgi:hypothetical protein